MSAKRFLAWAFLVAAAGCLFLADLPLLAEAPPASKKYAVLVGVKDYDHDKLKPLGYPEKDVEEMAALLRPAGYEVVVLTNTAGRRDPELAPTLANINAQFVRVVKKCKRQDLLLVCLTGHGLQFEKAKETDPDDAYFCPRDARPFSDERDTLLSLQALYRQLDRSGAGVKLLLVDACREEVPGRSKGVNGTTSPRPPRGVAALFSCSEGERAWESDKLEHGVFFHYVLEGLRGKAALEGEVTWDSLQQYVRRRVSRDVAGLIGPSARQTPELNTGGLLGDPPVLLNAPGREPGVTVAAGKPVQVRIVGPEGMQVGVQKDKQFPPPFRPAPCRLPLVAEATHRLKLSDIPRHPGVELYPTLKILKPDARSEAFLESSAIPIGVTEEDMEEVGNGKVVVKVLYLPKPEDGPAPPPDSPDGGIQILRSAKLSETDLVKQAARRGTVLAVFRLGNLDPEAP